MEGSVTFTIASEDDLSDPCWAMYDRDVAFEYTLGGEVCATNGNGFGAAWADCSPQQHII